MGIFSNTSKRNITTKDFYFGAPEAEGETVKGHSLTDYFEDYLDILGDLQKGKFIFVGRKGVGKSAIAKFIKDKSHQSNDSYATILRLSDLNFEKQVQRKNDTGDFTEFLFEWLILLNAVKLVVKNQGGKYTSEYEKLRKFLERNTGSAEIDKFQLDAKFISSGGEVSFGGLLHVFGGVFKKYVSDHLTKAPFYKLINPLKEILKIILEYPANNELELWLMFDDLDISYDINSDIDNQNIMKLLRIAKQYNNEIFCNCRAKILIFIRDDVRDFIVSKYSDSAKIFNSYEISINWYNRMKENDNPLKKMAQKRIGLNFQKHNIMYENDAWGTLIKNHDLGISKTSFKYVLDFTFYRPRDIITFLKTVSTDVYHYPIDARNLKKIIKKYININILEIKSELSLFFNETEKDKIFNELFRFIANRTKSSQEDVIKKIEDLVFNMESKSVLNILMSYSLLIYQNRSGDVFFTYRESNLEAHDIDSFYITLPKCIYHYYKPII